jgi:hypothetical protein
MGFVKSFIFRFSTSVLILAFSEFSLIQSSLPPRLDVGDILYLSAAKSKPLSIYHFVDFLKFTFLTLLN